MRLIDAENLKLAIRDDPEIDGQNFARMKMHIEEAAVAYNLSPTNADRIRAMSDEELARFLECFGCCHNCSEHHRLGDISFYKDEKCDEQCEQHCLEWLQQPVGEENG